MLNSTPGIQESKLRLEALQEAAKNQPKPEDYDFRKGIGMKVTRLNGQTPYIQNGTEHVGLLTDDISLGKQMRYFGGITSRITSYDFNVGSNGENTMLLETETGSKYSVTHAENRYNMDKVELNRDTIDSAYRNAQKEFQTSNTPENQQRLEVLRSLYGCYNNLMQDYPELKNIRLHDEPLSKNANFICLDNGAATVNYNFSHVETYLSGVYDKTTLASMAEKLGVEPELIANNPKLLATQILAHELGHAKESEEARKFLGGDITKLIGFNSEMRRRNEASQPIPVFEKGLTVYHYLNKYQRRLAQCGVHSPDDLRRAVSAGYRQMLDETYADDFAAKYLKKHWNELVGADPDKRPDRWVTASEDFAFTTGLVEGASIKLWPTKRDDKGGIIISGQPYEGFLADTIRIGERIRVNGSGIPNDHSKDQESSSPIRWVSVLDRTACIVRNDGKSYLMKVDHDRKPTEIVLGQHEIASRDGTKHMESDVNSELELSSSHTIQLLKRAKNNPSNATTGTYFEGHIAEPICIGQPIRFNRDDGQKEGSTSAVKKVIKRWNTYYVITDTSEYEIVPMY